MQAIVDMLHDRLVSPRRELASDVEDEIHATPSAGPRRHVDGLMKDACCGVDLALAEMTQGEVGQHDGQGLRAIVEATRGIGKDSLRPLVSAEREVARAGQPIERRLGEQERGGIVATNTPKMRFGGRECPLAVATVGEHGVRLGGVKETKAGQRVTRSGCGLRRLLSEQQAPGRVTLSVEGDEALPKEAMTGGDRIVDPTSGGDPLIEVAARGRVVASLGCVPDELAHERRGFGLAGVQLPAHSDAGGRVTKKRDLTQKSGGSR